MMTSEKNVLEKSMNREKGQKDGKTYYFYIFFFILYQVSPLAYCLNLNIVTGLELVRIVTKSINSC